MEVEGDIVEKINKGPMPPPEAPVQPKWASSIKQVWNYFVSKMREKDSHFDTVVKSIYNQPNGKVVSKQGFSCLELTVEDLRRTLQACAERSLCHA